MTFPETRYREAQQLLERLDHEIDTILAKVDSSVATGVRTLQEIKEWAGDWVDAAIKAVYALGRHIKEVAQQAKAELDKLRVGYNAPILANEFADKWGKLRGLATQVSADVRNPKSRFGPEKWEGKAADRYADAVGPQVTATDRISSTMDKVSNALTEAAIQTSNYVDAVLTATSILLVAMAAAVAAAVSGVFAAAGVVAFIGAGVNFFWQVRKASFDYLNIQLKLATQLEAEVSNVTEFPGGKWPQAASTMYSEVPTPVMGLP